MSIIDDFADINRRMNKGKAKPEAQSEGWHVPNLSVASRDGVLPEDFRTLARAQLPNPHEIDWSGMYAGYNPMPPQTGAAGLNIPSPTAFNAAFRKRLMLHDMKTGQLYDATNEPFLPPKSDRK